MNGCLSLLVTSSTFHPALPQMAFLPTGCPRSVPSPPGRPLKGHSCEELRGAASSPVAACLCGADFTAPQPKSTLLSRRWCLMAPAVRHREARWA